MTVVPSRSLLSSEILPPSSSTTWFHDREPQAGSLDTFRAGLGSPVESLKHAANILLCNPHPGVSDGKSQLPILALEEDFNLTFLSIFDRIVKQVEQDSP